MKQLKKKFVAKLMILVMLALVVPATDAQAASPKTKAYKAYANWLNKKAPSRYKKYALVKIDGDSVPELVGYYQKEYLEHYIICSYNGKKVTTVQFDAGVASSGGFRGTLMYLPGKGKILESYIYGGTGEGQDDIYLLKKGKIKITASGSSWYNSKGIQKFKWGKKSVSLKSYNKKLNKAFNTSKGKTFDKLKYTSKSSMKKKLR